MAGICPKCVLLREDGNVCPSCGTTLLSPAEWKAQRESWMAQVPEAPSETPVQAIAQGKEFTFGFFLGALLFFFAVLTAYLAFGGRLAL